MEAPSVLNRKIFPKGKIEEIPKYTELELSKMKALKEHEVHDFLESSEVIEQTMSKIITFINKEKQDFLSLVELIPLTKTELMLVLDYMILYELIDIDNGYYVLTKKAKKLTEVKSNVRKT